jgi:GNAT superfamily N-acetyltransferase
VKLHRIYLGQKTQGKGIGKKALSWLEDKAKIKGIKLFGSTQCMSNHKLFSFIKS